MRTAGAERGLLQPLHRYNPWHHVQHEELLLLPQAKRQLLLRSSVAPSLRRSVAFVNRRRRSARGYVSAGIFFFREGKVKCFDFADGSITRQLTANAAGCPRIRQRKNRPQKSYSKRN